MDYRIRWLNRFTASWMAYFWLADAEPVFRRLRQVRWKEWKTTATKRHNLRIRGISAQPLRGSPWPEDIEPHLAASQSHGLTNRRMRARMSGGVGRGGGPRPLPDL